MSHLRKAATTIVVALFSVGLVTVSATAATAADEGASAKKSTSVSKVSFRDSSWG